MALFFVEGFDTYAQVTVGDAGLNMHFKRNWDQNNWVRSDLGGIQAGRGGGNTFYCYSDNGFYNNWIRTFSALYPTIIMSCSWQCTGSTTGHPNHTLVTYRDAAGTEIGRLYYTGSGGQIAYRNGSGTNVLTTAVPGGITTTVWYTVECKVICGTTTGYVEIRINTVPYVASNVNTVGTALTTGMQQLLLGATGLSSNWNTSYIDHLFLMDATGASFNDFQGERRIQTVIPIGPGTYSQWTPTGDTPNWKCVDEAGIDQETTYNLTSTVNAKDTYDLQSLSTSLPVYAVQLGATIRKDDAPTRTAQFLLRQGTQDQLTGSPINLASDYSTRMLSIQPINPVTGAAWTAADINALEAGIQLLA